MKCCRKCYAMSHDGRQRCWRCGSLALTEIEEGSLWEARVRFAIILSLALLVLGVMML